jgi:cytochrome P450
MLAALISSFSPSTRSGWNGMDAAAKFDPHEDASTTPVDRFDVSRPQLYQDDIWRPYFERLRREDPVHLCENGMYGRYWSVTRYHDIMQVDTNPHIFSSDALLGGIVIRDVPADYRRPSFISMDPPKHGEQRKVVAPIIAPPNLQKLSGMIRERAVRILESLPRGETFDWVDRVSIELTTQMLATLFDFPFEERRKLSYWSNVTTVNTRAGTEIDSERKRDAVMQQALECFTALWNERAKQEPRPDLISMLAHGEATKDLPSRPHEFMGNLILLLVGGNDTTRNSISGGALALNQFPDEYRKLRSDPGLVSRMVPEIIRWQTPVIHMRRTALADTELRGKHIRKGDKVVMWYISGNRDETVIERADDLIIDRPRPRQHLSFGFGIHRCVGDRLAEMQLTILWEEILKRFPMIEVMGEPKRAYSNVLRGITSLPVRIPAS